MITVLLWIYKIVFAGFAVFFGYDIVKARGNGKLEKENPIKPIVVGFLSDFGDTLGIGSFAPTVFYMKVLRNNIHDKQIPGTLNVAHTLPVLTEAILFTTKVEVEPVTLIILIAAAVVGSYIGAGIISKLDEKKIQVVMGIALLATAILMLISHPKVNLFPAGGTATGLTAGKLVIGAIGNFILGALMTAGIGLYAPCMAMVYFLGMSPDVAFPIMMGSCALLMPVASAKFIKENAFNRINSLFICIAGIAGVFVAVKFFTSLPMDMLKILVIIVIFLTSFMMLRAAKKPAQPEQIEG